MSAILTPRDSALLFRTLAFNGAFSLGSGALMALFSGAVSMVIGFPAPLWLAAVGVGLLIFGGLVLWRAVAGRARRIEVWVVSLLDLAWVAGTVPLALLAPGLFNAAGVAVVVTVALVVLLLAALQLSALRRVPRIPAHPTGA